MMQDIAEAISIGDLDVLRARSMEVPALTVNQRLDKVRGDTLLTWACRHNQAAVVEWLLEEGADVGAKIMSDGCPNALCIACARGYIDCARVLLDGEAAFDLKALTVVGAKRGEGTFLAQNGAMALLAASWFGHTECVKLLSSYGASREACDYAHRFSTRMPYHEQREMHAKRTVRRPGSPGSRTASPLPCRRSGSPGL